MVYIGFIFAVVTITVTTPILFIIGLFRFPFKEYLYTISIGLDQLGGSLFYNKMNWTVSGYTGYLVDIENKKQYKILYDLINFLFQDKNHCTNAYKWDLEYDARKEINN